MAWGKAGSGDSPVPEWVRRLKADDDTLVSLFVMSFRYAHLFRIHFFIKSHQCAGERATNTCVCAWL